MLYTSMNNVTKLEELFRNKYRHIVLNYRSCSNNVEEIRNGFKTVQDTKGLRDFDHIMSELQEDKIIY